MSTAAWRVGEYTLLFDTNYQPKPAATALASAAAGGTGGSAPPPAPTTTPGSSEPSNPPSGGGTVPQWGQCGRIGWTGGTVCISPYKCTVQNAYYSHYI
ncbi:hypothetical protein MPER_11149 [Moniliophthora perniciosa FA553]|nr:hypothetical protein MPER_11149 [Moniliophthora perniciosa FA553]